MSQITVLEEWSQARSALAASLRAGTCGVLAGRHRVLSGFRWRDDLIVTAAEPLRGRRLSVEVVPREVSA